MSKFSGEGRGEKRVYRRGVLFYGAMALSASIAVTGASGSGCSSSSSSSSSEGCPSDKLTNIKKSYEFFDRALGGGNNASAEAAGMVGNFMQEDYACIVGDNIAQWNGDRLAALNRYESEHGQGLASQLNFAWDELEGKISGDNQHAALVALKGTSDPEDAALSFSGSFEKCGDCENSQREHYADQVYDDAQKYGWN